MRKTAGSSGITALRTTEFNFALRTAKFNFAVPVLLATVSGISACGLPAPAPGTPPGTNQQTRELPADLLASYPKAGDATAYGMPLAVNNAVQFLEWEQEYTLTPEQEALKKDALSALRATCCDDQTMYTCCCPCNLAKSVWGLSDYLIVERGYDAAAVREAALEWLRFIRPDYYQVRDLRQRGLDPAEYGLRDVDSCYDGLCERPFHEQGCGGMAELRLD